VNTGCKAAGGLTAINWDTIILTWVVIAIILVPLIIVSRNFTSGVPRGFQAVYEFVIEFVNGYAEQNLGTRRRRHDAAGADDLRFHSHLKLPGPYSDSLPEVAD